MTISLPLARLCGLLFSMGVAASVASAENPPAAVVEVFTSEGCSSCPPAEEMLSQLDREGGRNGLSVISLEWHVDYWDYLGWKDRFGSPEAAKRQYQYARALPSQVYTPQAVIEGTLVPEYAGDLAEVKALVRQALEHPSGARIDVSVAATTDPQVVQLNLSTQGDTTNARLLGLLVEDGLHSKPNTGENSGRELKHTHVVRRSQAFERAGEYNFALGPGIDKANSSIVVLLQDPLTLRILAAARAKLPGQASVSQMSQWNGRVTDSRGNPKSKVSLQACSARLCVPGSTDENGLFTFPSLPPGHYSLTVGTTDDVVEVTLSGGRTVTPVIVP